MFVTIEECLLQGKKKKSGHLLENYVLFPRLLLTKLKTEKEHPEYETCTLWKPHIYALESGGGS